MCNIFYVVTASSLRISIIFQKLRPHILPDQCTTCQWLSLHSLDSS